MALDLTPEQQEIFNRVVGIVTQNDGLRHQFKTAIDELHKQPNWDDFNYMTDSDDPPAANSRAVLDLVKFKINETEPMLSKNNPDLFSDIYDAICESFLNSKTGGEEWAQYT